MCRHTGAAAFSLLGVGMLDDGELGSEAIEEAIHDMFHTCLIYAPLVRLKKRAPKRRRIHDFVRWEVIHKIQLAV